MIFLMAVLFSAVTRGLGPSIFASILSVLIYDFFFVDPIYTFTIGSAQDLLALTIYLIVAVLTSNLTSRVRDQAEAARRREARTNVLYGLTREMAAAASLDGVLSAFVQQVAQTQAAQVVVLVPADGQILIRASQPAEAHLSEAEHAAAVWAWQHDEPTGRGADTLPGSTGSSSH